MRFTTLFTLAVPLVAWLSGARAATVIDVTFDHLSDLADGAKIPDARRAQDEGGNRHHGFYSGGGNSIHHTTNTPSGTSGADFSLTPGQGGVIIRDNLADGGAGSPNAWWGAGNTPLQPIIGATDSWTIESVINFQSQADVGSIISNNGAGSEWWWRVTGGDTLQSLFADADTTTGGISHTVAGGFDDDWHHVALIFDRGAGEVRTYYDYGLIGTTAFNPADYGAIGNATRDLEIGQFDGTSARDFDGFMDRIRISDQVLSTGEFMSIPEPGSVTLLGLAVCLLGRRRRP